MNVILPPTLENFVRERLLEGNYSSANEMVRDGLRLLMDQEESKSQHLVALREKIQIGLDQIDRGETVEMEEVFYKARLIIDKAKHEKA